jgi:thiamine pyrophosphate-dependent acetolactate synthase large subunit-like protein
VPSGSIVPHGVPDDLAPLFADAHRRLRPPGEPAAPVEPAALDAIVAACRAASAPVVLAGPRVIDAGAVDGLRALAGTAHLGVLNTWGAKGVFDWRSPHHLATAGLQALDFERGGLADADLIIATGVDRREAGDRWRLAPVVDVPPVLLGSLAARWTRPATAIAVPPLRTDLARVTQAGWARTAAPLAPTAVTRNYAEVLGAGGLVAADPGMAGYWVARTFATTGIGGAQVPADGAARGFAVACATVARLLDPARPVLAVVDALDDRHERLLALAAALGVKVAVEVWAADGDALDAEAHRRRLAGLVVTGGRAAVATDPGQLDEMIAVAGPIVAWTPPQDLESQKVV